MTDKEILIARLTLFLKKYGAYGEYIAGLARCGSHRYTIDDIAEWCVENGCRKHIIDHSFSWHRVSLENNQISWGYLNDKFGEDYNSLPYEEIDPDPQWDNMWDD